MYESNENTTVENRPRLRCLRLANFDGAAEEEPLDIVGGVIVVVVERFVVKGL